ISSGCCEWSVYLYLCWEDWVMSRISIKVGELEIEYEGEQKFITDGLLKLVKDILTALETTTMAQKLGQKSGAANLALAAAVHLTLVKNKEHFTHQELLTEMRTATTVYKSSYGSNIIGTLKRLVGDEKLSHVGGTNYALPEAERR